MKGVGSFIEIGMHKLIKYENILYNPLKKINILQIREIPNITHTLVFVGILCTFKYMQYVCILFKSILILRQFHIEILFLINPWK